MTRQLVLVHGRAQERKDPDDLKQEWLDALRAGLAKNGLSLPIPESDLHFPYYGDTLVQLLDGLAPDRAADVIVRGGPDDKQLELFLKQVMEEVRLEVGVTEDELRAAGGQEVLAKGPLNWEWVQTIMKVIDRHTPHGSAASIFLATRDVYHYLVDQTAKHEIDSGVAAAFAPGVETVVVAHSLGTVVAHALLRERGTREDWNVPQFVTLGSPLGVRRILKSISPPRWPACAAAWYNARDERDVVALYPLTPKHFPVGEGVPGIVETSHVRNDTPNRHGISGYLSDAAVAKVIHDALVG